MRGRGDEAPHSRERVKKLNFVYHPGENRGPWRRGQNAIYGRDRKVLSVTSKKRLVSLRLQRGRPLPPIFGVQHPSGTFPDEGRTAPGLGLVTGALLYPLNADIEELQTVVAVA